MPRRATGQDQIAAQARQTGNSSVID